MRTRVNLRARPHALALAALLLFQPLSQGAVPSFYTVTPVLSAIGNPLGVPSQGSMVASPSCGTGRATSAPC